MLAHEQSNQVSELSEQLEREQKLHKYIEEQLRIQEQTSKKLELTQKQLLLNEKGE